MGTDDESERSSTEQLAGAASSVARGAADIAKEVAGTVRDAVGGIRIPGAPGSVPPTVEEPTEPREPPPPKAEQRAPRPGSATGQGLPSAPEDVRSQAGAYLTTAQGTRLPDTDHSLTAGPRGPVLLQDHHLREKIMHFDHERIPERVVHARGRVRTAPSAPTAPPATSPGPRS